MSSLNEHITYEHEILHFVQDCPKKRNGEGQSASKLLCELSTLCIYLAKYLGRE